MRITGTRKTISHVEPYVAGKTIEEVKREYGLREVVKLGSNENPYGPFPSSLEAMREELELLNTYPDSTFEEIKKHIAAMFRLSAQNIAVSHGAGGMLETLAKTFIEEGDQVIIPQQSYRLYREISTLMGAAVVEVPLTEDYHVDVDAIRAEITEKTKLIWLCNPNNPTGTIVPLAKYRELITELPAHTWLVLDEAYAEFADPDLLPPMTTDIAQHNLIAVRTFSKAFGLAGARLGYAVAAPDVIRVIDTVAEPFNANRVGLAGATAALTRGWERYLEVRGQICADRGWLEDQLSRRGYEVVQSHANFVFFDSGTDTNALTATMLKRGVIVRGCAGWGYPHHLRVSVGTRAELERFIQVFDVTAGEAGRTEKEHAHGAV